MVEQMKNTAETHLGPCHPDVKIKWDWTNYRYAHTGYTNLANTKEVTIFLPQHQSDHYLAILSHLGHEIVHCLNPNGIGRNGGGLATVFEEGLATWFSIKIILGQPDNEYTEQDVLSWSNDDRYKRSFNFIEQLVADEGNVDNFLNKVKDLRIANDLPPLMDINSNMLAIYFTKSQKKVLDHLGQRFSDFTI